MLRSVTGTVLAVYVGTHFVNHALGVISIDAQDALLEVLAPIWQTIPGTLLLYGSLIIHALLGLYALWLRKTLRMPTWELAQLVFGLAVPLLLIPHVFGTRVAESIVGTHPTYHTVIATLWASPVAVVRQHWPEGTLLTLDVIVTNAGDPATESAIAQLKSDVLKIDGLSGPLDRWLGKLEQSGYAGYVGLEYKPTTTTEQSLAWLPRERRSTH